MQIAPEQLIVGFANHLEAIADALTPPDGGFNSNAGMGDRVIVEVHRPEEKRDETEHS